ncbi:MAG: fluoride efflux transporter CrcB [Pirellulales bacterium]
MPLIFAIAVGGALGSVLRHYVGKGMLALTGEAWYGTLTVNVVGSFAMGLFVAWFALRGNPSQEMRAFLTVGLLGGFTTLSSFSLDFATLFERKDYLTAFGYVAATLILSLGAIFTAMALVNTLFRDA